MIVKSPFDVAGNVVAITGSSRGIGLAIARLFRAHGAAVLICGHDEEETNAALATLRHFDSKGGVASCVGDIADPDYASAIVEKSYSAFGRLDTVICNAGIDIIKPAVDYTPSDWNRIIDVNLRGAFLVAQMAARQWIARSKPGSIILTSSIAGSVGISQLVPYAASKGGINQLTRTLAVEWALYGIRVNAIAPGYVENLMAGVTAHDDPASDNRIRSATPMGRRGTLDEIAAPFLFLASPAAGYITGTILAVDGGYTAA